MGKALGIVALVFGIIGVVILTFFLFISIDLVIISLIDLPFPTVAIVCGAIGIKKDDSPSLAKAGLVLGIVAGSILLTIIIIGLIILGIRLL